MAHRGKAEAPQRSCLGCKKCVDKGGLLRFVLTPEKEVLPDLENRLPGRGAYTCIDKRCLALAVEKRQFKRSYKQDVSVMDADQLIEYVRKQLHSRITSLIGLANKAGMITGGGSMVVESLRGRKKPGLVIVTTDISEAIGSKIVYSAEVNNVLHRTVVTKDDIGLILGKAPRSAIAVASSGFVEQLVRAIDRYRNFLGEV